MNFRLASLFLILLATASFATTITGTIQDCRGNATADITQTCVINTNSTITSTDFILDNYTNVTINQNVVVTLNSSRLLINLSAATFSTFTLNGQINASGTNALANSSGAWAGSGSSGGSAATAFLSSGTGARATSGAINGSNGTTDSIGTGITIAGNGSGLYPYFFTGQSAGAGTTSPYGGGFYATGGVRIAYSTSTAMTASGATGGSGQPVYVQAYTINISSTGIILDSAGNSAAACAGGSVYCSVNATGSGGGEMILSGDYIYVAGNITGNGAPGATNSSALPRGNSSILRICAANLNVTTGIINLTGNTSFAINYSSTNCFPQLVRISSPAPTTYSTIPPINITCQGAYASYYLNVTDSLNGTLLANQPVTDGVLFSFSPALLAGNHTLTGTCWNGTYNGSISVSFTILSAISLMNSLNSSVFETEGNTLNTTITGSFNITSYNLTVYYNNTLVLNSTMTGVNALSFTISTPIISPLRLTAANVSFNASVSAIVNGVLVSNSSAANQTVNPWYNITNYTYSVPLNDTLEQESTITIMNSTAPPNAAFLPNISYSYVISECNDTWITATTQVTNHTTCNQALLSVSSLNSLLLASSHEQTFAGANYKVQTVYYVTRIYNFSLTGTGFTSATSQNQTNTSMKSDRYFWLFPSINGTSATNQTNMSALYNTTFYNEINLDQMNISQVAFYQAVMLPDGTVHAYNLTTANSNISTFTLKQYPNVGTYNESFVTVTGSGVSLIKSNYVTRNIIYGGAINASNPHTVQWYLLPMTTTYSAVVISALNYPTAYYVKVLKRQGASWNPVDDRYLTSYMTGNTANDYFSTVGYYQVSAYDQYGNCLVQLNDTQIACSTGTCTLSLQSQSGSIGNQTITVPVTGEMWKDVNYSILPVAYYVNTPTNITFTVSSAAATLQYWGMNVTTLANSSNCTIPPCIIPVCFGNATTAAGGTLYCTINQTGMYYVTGWFRDYPYQEFDTGVKGIQYINSSFSFQQVRETFATTPPISPWGYYFVAIVAAMVAGGFVSRYTMDGAGLAGLAVLWIFTLLYPGGQLVQVMGSTYLTIMGATIITSIAVVLAMYAVWRGN